MKTGLKGCNMKLPFSHFLLSSFQSRNCGWETTLKHLFCDLISKAAWKDICLPNQLPRFSVLHSSWIQDSFLQSGMVIHLGKGRSPVPLVTIKVPTGPRSCMISSNTYAATADFNGTGKPHETAKGWKVRILPGKNQRSNKKWIWK